MPIFFTLIFSINVNAVVSTTKDLRILTSEIPPMIFTEGGQVKGFCVELAKEIQRRLGNNVEIEVLPWPRAYLMGQTLSNVVLICPKRTPEREKLFKWMGPVLESSTNFYKKSGSSIKITSLDEAKNISGILIPRNFYSIAELKSKGFTNIIEINTMQLALLMLLKERGPILIMEEVQALALLKEIHEEPTAIEVAYKLGNSVSYFAFSNNTSDALVKKWQRTLNQMKEDGTFAKIFDKSFRHTKLLK